MAGWIFCLQDSVGNQSWPSNNEKGLRSDKGRHNCTGWWFDKAILGTAWKEIPIRKAIQIQTWNKTARWIVDVSGNYNCQDLRSEYGRLLQQCEVERSSVDYCLHEKVMNYLRLDSEFRGEFAELCLYNFPLQLISSFIFFNISKIKFSFAVRCDFDWCLNIVVN